MLYGDCGNGFRVDEVFGDSRTMPGHFTKKGEPGDRAMFDAEAPQSAAKFYRLGYTCVRLIDPLLRRLAQPVAECRSDSIPLRHGAHNDGAVAAIQLAHSGVQALR